MQFSEGCLKHPPRGPVPPDPQGDPIERFCARAGKRAHDRTGTQMGAGAGCRL